MCNVQIVGSPGLRITSLSLYNVLKTKTATVPLGACVYVSILFIIFIFFPFYSIKCLMS